jgi:hypothetical protein
MLVCNKCGKVIEDYELGTTKQCHGLSSLGQAFEEELNELCTCGGEFVEATECKSCGVWYDNAELHGVCEYCMQEYELVDIALEMGDCDLSTVEGINGFVTSVLSVKEINKILKKWVEENFIDHSKPVKDYLYNDKMEFSEFIINSERGCK